MNPKSIPITIGDSTINKGVFLCEGTEILQSLIPKELTIENIPARTGIYVRNANGDLAPFSPFSPVRIISQL